MDYRDYSRREIFKLLTLSAVSVLVQPFSLEASNKSESPFRQNSLGYRFDALEPFIDALTMEIHYSKHASGYCNELNKALSKLQSDYPRQIEVLLAKISQYPTQVRNFAGGHYNHELFWKCMTPGGKALTNRIFEKEIINTFGSIDNLKKEFTANALSNFGSGWTWLCLNESNQLRILATPNQDNPVMDIAAQKGYPLLCLDTWEHAYYLKYQNRRADYIAQWWNIVDWNFVSERYINRIG